MTPFLTFALTLVMAATSMAAAVTKPSTKPFYLGDRGEQIVGGTAASSGEFPYIVSLSQSGSHFCGGVLLNAYTVVTAAHCSKGQTASSVKVRAGSLVSRPCFLFSSVSHQECEHLFPGLAFHRAAGC